MAKRSATRKGSTSSTEPAQESPSPANSTDKRIVAFAEQLGRLAGTVHRKADGLADRRVLVDQLTRIRNAATELLAHLGSTEDTSTQAPTKSANGRSGGTVDAPGKKHRKAPERRPGIKHSDERIAKLAAARQVRPARRG